MATPIRIVVWGIGNVGRAVVKMAVRRPDIEVVGGLVYSPAKDRQDIGALCGIDDLGVLATTDREAVIALKPDAIIYLVQDVGDNRADAEVEELLRRGMNVVTTLPYHHVEMRGAEFVERLEAAGREGGGTLFAAGINPGFFPERLALALTGMTAEVDELLVEEFYSLGAEPALTLQTFGFGIPAPAEGERSPAVAMVEGLESQFIHYLAEKFGTHVEKLVYTPHYVLAERRIELENFTIEPGTVAYWSHRWDGHTEAGTTVSFQNHWWAGDDLAPEELPSADFYRVSIEGRPSVRVGIELLASLKDNSRLYPGDDQEPVYWASASTLLLVLPGVIAAPPGVRRIQPAANGHYRALLTGTE